MPSKKFDAFEGKRYFDYYFKYMKRIHFGKDKLSKCCQCGTTVSFENGFYGYNNLRCKKCYEKFCRQASDEVDRVFNDI